MGKFLFLIVPLYLLLTSCPSEWDRMKSEYQPVLMLRTDLEKSVRWMPPSVLVKPGNIYTKGKYLYVNEKYLGIHVIDNTDPTKPQHVGFINVPGCIDMAIRGDYLYVDNAVDLVTIDLTIVPSDIRITSRIRDAFPELTPPDENQLASRYTDSRPENSIIVGWKKISE